MMMNRIKSLLLALTFLAAFAAQGKQINVDLNRISFDVTSNPGNYGRLMDRYLAGDMSLTPEEMATVYYGYASTPDYDPTDRFGNLDEAYTAMNYPEVWRLAKDAMQVNPVSLDVIIKALVAANNISDADARKQIPVLQNRYELLSNLILCSGKGTAPETPFIVICEDDMLRIVRNVICAETIIGRAMIKNIDAVKLLLPGSDRQHILYFDNNLQKAYERRQPLNRAR